MPKRSQQGGAMNETFAQHAGHNPPRSPSGERQAAHKGGSTASSANRTAARPHCAMRAKTGRRRAPVSAAEISAPDMSASVSTQSVAPRRRRGQPDNQVARMSEATSGILVDHPAGAPDIASLIRAT